MRVGGGAVLLKGERNQVLLEIAVPPPISLQR